MTGREEAYTIPAPDLTEAMSSFAERFGPMSPAVSMKRARIADEGPPRGGDWIDHHARNTVSTRNEKDPLARVAARTLHEPEYDEDPADQWRTRRAVDEWSSPIDRPGYPDVTISDRYRFSLAVAERWLEYAPLSTSAVHDALVLLAVEFDMDSEAEVWKVLAWMGIEKPSTSRAPRGKRGRDWRLKVPFERVPNHGTHSEYQNHGCRCEECREAARNRRAAKMGRDPSTIKRYRSQYAEV